MATSLACTGGSSPAGPPAHADRETCASPSSPLTLRPPEADQDQLMSRRVRRRRTRGLRLRWATRCQSLGGPASHSVPDSTIATLVVSGVLDSSSELGMTCGATILSRRVRDRRTRGLRPLVGYACQCLGGPASQRRRDSIIATWLASWVLDSSRELGMTATVPTPSRRVRRGRTRGLRPLWATRTNLSPSLSIGDLRTQ